MAKFYLFFLIVLVFGCKKPLQSNTYYETNYATGTSTPHSGIAIPHKKENYPIDVFFKPEKPEFVVENIQEISISAEDLNTEKEYLVNNRMVQRGKSVDEKKQLIGFLIERAINLGATCLYEVNYQFYTDRTSSGYILSGIAGRYTTDQKASKN